MSFSGGSWAAREATLGDPAEECFREVYELGFADYGLRRPPIQVHRLSPKVRYTPDFVTSAGLIEAMGVGNDQILKLKLEKFVALLSWATDETVQLFIYDSCNERYCFVPMASLHLAIAQHAEYGVFDDGKPYHGIDIRKLEVAWHARKS